MIFWAARAPGKGTQAKRLVETQAWCSSPPATCCAPPSPPARRSGEGEGHDGAGELVSDEIVIGIDRGAPAEAGRRRAIFDGFPRTVAQAEALDAMLASKGRRSSSRGGTRVDEEALVHRIVKRVGRGQGRRPAGAQGRQSRSFKARLAAYNAQTAPLLPYYQSTAS